MTTTLVQDRSTTRTSAADAVRVLVHDALSVAAGDAADTYSSRTPVGGTLLSLAALARQAAALLGAEPGTPLTAGPGVLVERELAAAARLLDRAARGSDGEPPEVGDVLDRAQRLHAQLLEAAAATRR